jgi:spore coat polysaccharide biosynthesis protein SpsF
MLKTLGIVQACFRTPLARSRAARKLGGKPVLEWIVRRATDCQKLSGVIVATCDDPQNEFVSRLVPLDVPVLVGKKQDSLGCFAAALEAYPVDAAVRIGADCPFIDPMLIDRLVTAAGAHPDCDYVGYCSRDGRPAVLSSVGVYAEWVRTSAVFRAAQKAKLPADRGSATRYIYSHPEKFRVCLVPAPEQIDRDDVRLTVDIEEDWDHALTIFEALGPEGLDWPRIASLLDHQPALRQRMAALNRDRAGT